MNETHLLNSMKTMRTAKHQKYNVDEELQLQVQIKRTENKKFYDHSCIIINVELFLCYEIKIVQNLLSQLLELLVSSRRAAEALVSFSSPKPFWSS